MIQPVPEDVRKKYEAHIRSSAWRNTREALFKLRGRKCEMCGFSSHRLEIHHLAYERIGKERLEDLVIVCQRCHKIADSKREQESTQKRIAKAAERDENRMQRAFDTWCNKRGVFDPGEQDWEEFTAWLDGQRM